MALVFWYPQKPACLVPCRRPAGFCGFMHSILESLGLESILHLLISSANPPKWCTGQRGKMIRRLKHRQIFFKSQRKTKLFVPCTQRSWTGPSPSADQQQVELAFYLLYQWGYGLFQTWGEWSPLSCPLRNRFWGLLFSRQSPCLLRCFEFRIDRHSMKPGNLSLPWIVQFSRSVMSNSLPPHESQHARPPYPSQTPRVYSNSSPSSRWCHPAISSSVFPFSSCP